MDGLYPCFAFFKKKGWMDGWRDGWAHPSNHPFIHPPGPSRSACDGLYSFFFLKGWMNGWRDGWAHPSNHPSIHALPLFSVRICDFSVSALLYIFNPISKERPLCGANPCASKRTLGWASGVPFAEI